MQFGNLEQGFLTKQPKSFAYNPFTGVLVIYPNTVMRPTLVLRPNTRMIRNG